MPAYLPVVLREQAEVLVPQARHDRQLVIPRRVHLPEQKTRKGVSRRPAIRGYRRCRLHGAEVEASLRVQRVGTVGLVRPIVPPELQRVAAFDVADPLVQLPSLFACCPTLLLCVEPAAGLPPHGVIESVDVITGNALPVPVHTPLSPMFVGQS